MFVFHDNTTNKCIEEIVRFHNCHVKVYHFFVKGFSCFLFQHKLILIYLLLFNIASSKCLLLFEIISPACFICMLHCY